MELIIVAIMRFTVVRRGQQFTATKVLSEIHTVVSRCVVFDGGRVLLFVSAARYRAPASPQCTVVAW